MEPDERRHVPHTEIHHLSRRFLEAAQDLLVVALVLVLFGLMVRTLLILLSHLFGPALDFRIVIAEVLFMLVMWSSCGSSSSIWKSTESLWTSWWNSASSQRCARWSSVG